MALQNWEDEDVGAALEALEERLAANIVLLSSWDKYKKEVLSRQPGVDAHAHQRRFWAENAPSLRSATSRCAARAQAGTRSETHCPHPCLGGVQNTYLSHTASVPSILAAFVHVEGSCTPSEFLDSMQWKCPQLGHRCLASLLQLLQMHCYFCDKICAFVRHLPTAALRASRSPAQVLRVLLKLLEASRDSRTLAVGASDLGHFISAHPHGRAIVTGERAPFSHLTALLPWNPGALRHNSASAAQVRLLAGPWRGV